MQRHTVTVAVPAGAPAPVEVTAPVIVTLPPGTAGDGLVVTAITGGAAVTPRVNVGRVVGPAKPAPGMYTKVTLDTPTWAVTGKGMWPGVVS